MSRVIQGDSRNSHSWNNFLITRLMKNCFMQKLYGFKAGKIWRINFFMYVEKIFKVTSIFFKLNYIFVIVNRKSIKFQVKKY